MRRLLLLVLLGILALSACRPAGGWSEQPPLPSPTPTSIIYENNDDDVPLVEEPVERTPLPPEPTPRVDDDPKPEEVDIDCGEIFCTLVWPGWLERPIGEGLTRTIDRSYPYGSTGDGLFDPHHGVEFLNRHGTPVLAVQNGEVIFAGMDDMTRLGPFGGFYGNVVVLQHGDLLGNDKQIFTLYAHLSEIGVEMGDQVALGEELGRVGGTGAAFGPHLHFETRVDINDYAHTVNPVLWFAPLDDTDHQGTAVLAGLILDQGGKPVPEFPLTLEKIAATGEVEGYYYPLTYFPVGMNAHPLLGENFTVPDIPAGDYRLAFISGRLYEVFFTLEPGTLGFIKVQLD
jgi:murein DD-endopeptidase MepM/ murein hydrolase activator NlpD